MEDLHDSQFPKNKDADSAHNHDRHHDQSLEQENDVHVLNSAAVGQSSGGLANGPSPITDQNRSPRILRTPVNLEQFAPNNALAPEAKATNLGSGSGMASGSTPAAVAAPAKKGGIKKFFKLVIAAIVLVLVGIFGTHFVIEMMTYESTDDAFVTAHVHTVTAKIGGTVIDVLVDDHDFVKENQLLVRIDPRDYQAQVAIAQSAARKAGQDIGRMHRGHVIDPDEEGNVDGVDLGSAEAYAPDERKILDEYGANSSEAANRLKIAELNLDYTIIRSPATGRIGKRSVETGQVVAAGQALMALVEPESWINANFKETQLGKIRVGQKVTISIDAIPDHKFSGVVDSIAAASGSTYSLLPPDNATGNFTKVVQRVPVKITFDPASVKGYEDRIAVGMSTEVSIRIKN